MLQPEHSGLLLDTPLPLRIIFMFFLYNELLEDLSDNPLAEILKESLLSADNLMLNNSYRLICMNEVVPGGRSLGPI